MDEKTCYEIIHKIDAMSSFSTNMGKAHNIEDYQNNYKEYDKLRQDVITTLKNLITEEK